MNYIGRKHILLQFLHQSIHNITQYNITHKSCQTFCDLFAGTATVGIHFKKHGYTIIANDIQYYSYVLNRHAIGTHKQLPFYQLCHILTDLPKTPIQGRKHVVCQYLTNLQGIKGFIYNHYTLGGTANQTTQRLYFSDYNAQKCDTIRQHIEYWKTYNLISNDEYFFLLSSLLQSMDKYANTTSVYSAFLKRLKKSAQSLFVLHPAAVITTPQPHQVYQQDSNILIHNIFSDILYLDPPYNQRQYATNYHLLETIAHYDNPCIYGKTGLRDSSQQKSLYCSRSKVKDVFSDLIRHAHANYIFLSYNNEGLMTHSEIRNIMSLRGEYGYFTKPYTRFKADTTRNYKTHQTTEYLHYVIVR